MEKILIKGIIEISNNAIEELIKEVLSVTKVRTRFASDAEFTLLYDDNKYELYCHETLNGRFLLDLELNGGLSDGNDLIEKFKNNLSNKYYAFEWFEIDENSEIVGEGFEIKSEN